jgi:hypothetical protein
MKGMLQQQVHRPEDVIASSRSTGYCLVFLGCDYADPSSANLFRFQPSSWDNPSRPESMALRVHDSLRTEMLGGLSWCARWSNSRQATLCTSVLLSASFPGFLEELPLARGSERRIRFLVVSIHRSTSQFDQLRCKD